MEKASASGSPQKEKAEGRDGEREDCVSFLCVSDLFVIFMQNPHLKSLSIEDGHKNPVSPPAIAVSFPGKKYISPCYSCYHAMLSAPCSLWRDPFNILERCLGHCVIFINTIGLPGHNFYLTENLDLTNDEVPCESGWVLYFPCQVSGFSQIPLNQYWETYLNPIILSQPFYGYPTLRSTQSCRESRRFLLHFKFEYTWPAPYQKIQFSHISIIPETEKWAHKDTFMSKNNPQTSFLSLANKAVI